MHRHSLTFCFKLGRTLSRSLSSSPLQSSPHNSALQMQTAFVSFSFSSTSSAPRLHRPHQGSSCTMWKLIPSRKLGNSQGLSCLLPVSVCHCLIFNVLITFALYILSFFHYFRVMGKPGSTFSILARSRSQLLLFEICLFYCILSV